MGVLLSGMATGMQHLRDANIAHNDIKPENVLLSLSPQQINIKLCDLGNVWFGSPGEARVRDGVGSGGFMAPECIMEDQYW